MKTLIQRSMFACAALAAFALGASATAASAATGPWNWTDISTQLSLRQNRTVWAMVHAGNSYVETDGTALTDAGRVLQTNQTGFNVDLTSAVVNAGMTRVDDMTTDGTTVVLLKNMNASVNTAEVVSFANGQAVNHSTQMQQALASNEGIAAIAGNNGSWMIATTRGNLLSWDGATTPKKVSLTDAYVQDVKAIPALANGTNGYVPSSNGQRRDIASSINLAAVNNKFLITLTMSTGVKVFQYDGFNLSDITSLYPANMTQVLSIASNGTNALFLVSKTSGTSISYSLIRTDATFASENAVTTNIAIPTFPKMVWTGGSWMILSGKNIYRLAASGLESYGQTRDFFSSVASDGMGNVLLGGAASNNSFPDAPSYPMTAKLVSVVEGMSAQQTMASTNGTSFWTWLEPNMTVLRRDQTTSYNVGAWDANGVKSIEVFVNWSSKKIVDFGPNSTGNQNVKITLNGSDYPANSTISLIAKITDEQGNATWTTFTTLAVKDATISLAANTSAESTTSLVSTWFWLEPNVSSVDIAEQVTLHAQANAANGLNRIEFIINGNATKFCDFARAYGTQDCTATLTGSDYALGSSLAVTVKATDGYGKYAIGNARTIDIRNNNQNAGAHPATIGMGTTPNTDILRNGQEVTVAATAQDVDGIDHIDLLANGKVIQTCTFANAYDTRECSAPVSAARFPDTTNVSVTARVTDATGHVTLSDSRFYTIAK